MVECYQPARAAPANQFAKPGKCKQKPARKIYVGNVINRTNCQQTYRKWYLAKSLPGKYAWVIRIWARKGSWERPNRRYRPQVLLRWTSTHSLYTNARMGMCFTHAHSAARDCAYFAYLGSNRTVSQNAKKSANPIALLAPSATVHPLCSPTLRFAKWCTTETPYT